MHGLVGENADGLAVEATEAREQFPGEQLLDLEPASFVDDRVDQLAHVIAAVRFLGDELGDWFGRDARGFCFAGSRFLAGALWHVAEIGLGEFDRFAVVADQGVAQTALRGVHARAAQLLEADLLSDDDLDHARRPEVHRGVALDHDHDIAESWNVGAACG